LRARWGARAFASSIVSVALSASGTGGAASVLKTAGAFTTSDRNSAAENSRKTGRPLGHPLAASTACACCCGILASASRMVAALASRLEARYLKKVGVSPSMKFIQPLATSMEPSKGSAATSALAAWSGLSRRFSGMGLLARNSAVASLLKGTMAITQLIRALTGTGRFGTAASLPAASSQAGSAIVNDSSRPQTHSRSAACRAAPDASPPMIAASRPQTAGRSLRALAVSRNQSSNRRAVPKARRRSPCARMKR